MQNNKDSWRRILIFYQILFIILEPIFVRKISKYMSELITSLGLRSLGLKHIYVTGRQDLAKDFFIPSLTQSVKYDRAVGYFSSGWIRINAQGLAELAVNGGQARWVTSPILSEEDILVLEKIVQPERDQIIIRSLLSSVENLTMALEKDTLNTMAWMVADNLLQFRFAIPVGHLDGDFHDKFGIFQDNTGQRVTFSGSYNDTVKGFHNYESIRVFFSWESATSETVDDDEQRFTRIWLGREPNLRIFNLPQAVRNQILELRSNKRPYDTSTASKHFTSISLKEIFPREYQLQAVEKWEGNGRCGILDMATGTGKTTAALSAITKSSDAGYIVIATPTKALVSQWLDELQKLDGLRTPFIEVSSENRKWREQALPRLRLLGLDERDKRPFVFVGTYQSLAGEDFRNLITNVNPINTPGLLIADEVHHMGATYSQNLMNTPFSWRLGLTATLDRAHDEIGTQAILDYFRGIVFQLGLADAVGTILCRYQYNILFAELTEDEFTEYQQLTAQIARLEDKAKTGDSYAVKSRQYALIARSRITKLAQNKLELLQELILKMPPHRCLIYCADLEQVTEVQEILGRLRVPNLPYTSEQNSEQRSIALHQLERNDIAAVVAIDCLDEGVDVPQVHQAILVASSTSERQFIQRRGRILRKATGKKFAFLTDILGCNPVCCVKDFE